MLLVYVFGSAAHRDRGSVRDVDVAVLTDPPLSLDELVADFAAAVRQWLGSIA